MLKLLQLEGPPVSAGLEAAIRHPARIRREILPAALEAAKMFISKPVERPPPPGGGVLRRRANLIALGAPERLARSLCAAARAIEVLV